MSEDLGFTWRRRKSGEVLVMARLTGNYKHGNERLAASHPRNARR